MTEQAIYDIPMKDIKVSDQNVRHTDADVDINDLAASIEVHGQLQPVVLRGEKDDGPTYELIVGQRRYLAHKKLGSATIRATFAGNITDLQAKIRSLAENVHRVPLNHADAADAVTSLYKHYHNNERKVARELGLSLQRVRQYIDVKSRATPKMMGLLRKKKVSLVDVRRALDAAAGDTAKAERFVVEIGRLPTPAKKRLVDYGRAHPSASKEKVLEEANKPRLETTVLVDLPMLTRQALDKAAKDLAMGTEEVAARAVTEWLTTMGFLRRSD